MSLPLEDPGDCIGQVNNRQPAAKCVYTVCMCMYMYVYIYIYILLSLSLSLLLLSLSIIYYYYYYYYIYMCVCAYMYVQLYAMYSKQQRDTVSIAGDMSCATKSLWPGFQKLKPCRFNIKAAYQTFGRRLFLLLEQGNKLLKQISQPVTFDPGC